MPEETQQKIIMWPKDVETLSQEEFYNETSLSQINGMAVEFANTGDIDNSKELASILSEKLRSTVGSGTDKDVLASYTETLGIAKASAERFTSNRRSYLKSSILSMIKNGVDPVGFFVPVFTFTDTIGTNDRMEAVKAFEQNTEELGKKLIITGRQTEGYIRPTIANWLLDFHTFMGRGEPRPTINSNITNYLQNSKNYVQLNKDEKEYLKEIFHFYAWLLTPTPLYIKAESDDMVGGAREETETRTRPAPQKEQARPVASGSEEFSASAEIQQATPPDATEAIRALTQKYDLRVDEAGVFGAEVRRVLAGQTHPDNFVGRMQQMITTLSDEELQSLINDTNKELFEPVRQQIISRAEEQAAPADGQPKSVPTFSTERQEESADAFGDVEKRLAEDTYTPHETKRYTGDDTTEETPSSDKTSQDPYREPIDD